MFIDVGCHLFIAASPLWLGPLFKLNPSLLVVVVPLLVARPLHIQHDHPALVLL